LFVVAKQLNQLNQMQLATHKHSLAVDGLEFDSHATQPATLAGFDSLTIGGTLILSYPELVELTPSNTVNGIWQALEMAAQAEGERWKDHSTDLREWLASL